MVKVGQSDPILRYC